MENRNGRRARQLTRMLLQSANSFSVSGSGVWSAGPRVSICAGMLAGSGTTGFSPVFRGKQLWLAQWPNLIVADGGKEVHGPCTVPSSTGFSTTKTDGTFITSKVACREACRVTGATTDEEPRGIRNQQGQTGNRN